MEKLEILESMYRTINETFQRNREESISTDYVCRNRLGKEPDLCDDAEIHIEVRGKDLAKVIEEFHLFCKPQE